MRIRLIPTAAVVALSESTTQMDFAAGDGWAMSQDYDFQDGVLVGGIVAELCQERRRGSGRQPAPRLRRVMAATISTRVRRVRKISWAAAGSVSPWTHAVPISMR